jgi:hypothetical protein
MDYRAAFLASVAKILPKTHRVLEFYNVCPNPNPTELNFEPYVGGLFGVCREHRKGFDGIDDLRKIVALFKLLHSHRLDCCTSEVITSGLDALKRHNAWLDSTFPEVLQVRPSVN